MANKGLTLTELLVSLVLVGIVMLGVASFNFTTRSIHDSSSKSNLIAMHVSALMSRIERDASSVSSLPNDWGIREAADNSWIAFRRDEGAPGELADDTWYIYKKNLADHELIFCTQTAAVGPTPNASCTNVISDQISAINFDLILDEATSELYTDVEITAVYNPSQASSTPTERMDNPTFTLRSKIFPNGMVGQDTP